MLQNCINKLFTMHVSVLYLLGIIPVLYYLINNQ